MCHFHISWLIKPISFFLLFFLNHQELPLQSSLMHPDTSLIEMALCCALCGTLSGSHAPEETFNFFHGEQKNSFVETCIFWMLNWEKNLSALVTTEEVRICGLSVIMKILRRDERWKKNHIKLFSLHLLPCDLHMHLDCIFNDSLRFHVWKWPKNSSLGHL